MDKDWAEKNKEIQKLISKEATFNVLEPMPDARSYCQIFE